MTTQTAERLRLKEPNLRLGQPAHREAIVLERYPISKTLNVRFDGGRVGCVREDQMEPIPPPAEEPEAEGKVVAVDLERVKELGAETVAREIVESEGNAA